MNLRVLGVMTGTSCDALDAACVEFSRDGWASLWRASAPYPPALRKRVLTIQKSGSKHPLRMLLELERDLGSWYGTTLRELIDKNAARGRPDAIANHGQTIAHFPPTAGGGKSAALGMSLQAGEPAIISHVSELTVLSHFRQGDLAAGGQGAPLVPAFHRMIASRLPEARTGIAIHNIGGMSNLTYLGDDDEPLAFDTGPGNAWIDLAAGEASRGKLQMDLDGKLALRGQVDEKALKRLLAHPFYKKPPPKSTGRDDFPYSLFQKATRTRGADRVATATAVTVESIARSYQRWILDEERPLAAIYLCGGGARNPALVQGLRAKLPQIQIKTLEDAGLDSQAVEAEAFAFFGFLSLLGRSFSGSWTGADTDHAPPARITPGKNWRTLLSKLEAFIAAP